MKLRTIKKSYGVLSLGLVFIVLFCHQIYTVVIISPLSRNSAERAYEYLRWLKKSEEEIRKLGTYSLNSTYKNPCWYVDGKLNCLPYFYLAGMPKCGTTDLWAKITKHPHITLCGWNPTMRSTCICRKEPHWWGKHRFKYGETIDSYLAHWATFAKQIELNILPASKQIIGDGSASTFWQLTYRHNVSYKSDPLEYTTAHLIRVVQPNSKFIVIFRNPSERLYSQYNYQKEREVKTPENFHESIEYSIKRASNCVNSSSLRGCAYLRTLGNTDNLLWIPRIFLGWYDVFVTDWLKSFPRKQFLFLRLEDWKKDCVNILPKVYEFLEVEQLSNTTVIDICKKEAENVNILTKEKMLPQTKALLDEFYRPNLKRLAFILGDDRFSWKD